MSGIRELEPLRGSSMQRCALLDWSVRLRGANPNYAPRTPPMYRVGTMFCICHLVQNNGQRRPQNTEHPSV